MNFKRQAKRLESFLEEEFNKKQPIAVMPDGTTVYKEFKIKPTASGAWGLYRIKGLIVDVFETKACALIAANYYSNSRFDLYNEIKLLDSNYHKNFVDSTMFKQRSKTAKDVDLKDLALWRWEITSARANYAKQEISRKFNSMF